MAVKRPLVALLLAAASACAPLPSADGSSAAVRQVASFGEGRFLESVIHDGAALFIGELQSGQIYRMVPGESPILWSTLPAGKPGEMTQGLFCMAADGIGGVFVNVLHSDAAVQGVWHVDASGAPRRIATVPQGVVPNGLARHRSGDLYLADSAAGGIWRVRRGSSEAELWSDHSLLRPRAVGREFPAVNGLQIAGDWVYVTVSDTLRVVRVPILAHGRAGAAELVAEGIGGDDFAIGPDGVLYVTTHPFNTVERIAPNGSRTTIMSAGDDVIGPTAATIGPDADGRPTLWVVTDGGLYRPLSDGLRPAALFAMSLE